MNIRIWWLALPVSVTLIGCTTLSAINAKNKKIRASSIKNDADAQVVAQAFAKEVERCEAGDLQDCIYGLRYGPADEEGGKKIALGICSAWPNYFDNAEHAPCRWTCANVELAHRKECVGAYGYTAILQPTAALRTFPEGRSSTAASDLPLGLKAFWGVVETNDAWKANLDGPARALASGGSLRTLALKEKGDVSEFLVLFDGERVGFVRWQRLPQDADGQYFLAKAEEKYGKAERIKVSEPLSKLYGWSHLGKRQRYLGVVRGEYAGSDTELGQLRHGQVRLASADPAADSSGVRLAKNYPDHLVTVVVDLDRLQQLVKDADTRVKAKKGGADAEATKARQQQINAVKY